MTRSLAKKIVIWSIILFFIILLVSFILDSLLLRFIGSLLVLPVFLFVELPFQVCPYCGVWIRNFLWAHYCPRCGEYLDD